MTIAQIKELVDHISETWRDGAPAEQHTDLADLDAALAELDEMEIDSQTAAEAVAELRGRVEILMDEIDIALGIEPPPMDNPAGPDDDEAVEFASHDKDEPLLSIDDPKASDLMTAVQSHLAAGQAGVLREDLEAIDALDHDASSALKARLDELRSKVEHRLTELADTEATAPSLTPAPLSAGRPASAPVPGRSR